MESDILRVADYAVKQNGVSGFICVDREGLCLTAQGQAHHSMSGIIHQIADLASKIEEHDADGGTDESKKSPVIRVDLERYRILIQSRESTTTALISPQK